jgi:hypothetical protein
MSLPLICASVRPRKSTTQLMCKIERGRYGTSERVRFISKTMSVLWVRHHSKSSASPSSSVVPLTSKPASSKPRKICGKSPR